MGGVLSCLGTDRADYSDEPSQAPCQASLGSDTYMPRSGAERKEVGAVASAGINAAAALRYVSAFILIVSGLVAKQWSSVFTVLGVWFIAEVAASVRKRRDLPVTSGSLASLEARWAARVSEESEPVLLAKADLARKNEADCIEWNVEGSNLFFSELHRVSKSDLSRYFLARGGDVGKALQLAENVTKWRAAVCPSMVVLPQIANAIAQGVWWFAGWTKCGYPILVCDASLWAPSKYSNVDEYIRYVAYFLEVLVKKRMGLGVTKFVTIFELSGFSTEMVRPIAMRCLVHLSRIVQEINAERAAAIYFVNSNAVFRMSWHLIAPLADSRTRQKIHWPLPHENREVLGKIIALTQLEQRFGGDFKGNYAPLQGHWEVDAGIVPPPAFDPDAPLPE